MDFPKKQATHLVSNVAIEVIFMSNGFSYHLVCSSFALAIKILNSCLSIVLNR